MVAASDMGTTGAMQKAMRGETSSARANVVTAGSAATRPASPAMAMATRSRCACRASPKPVHRGAASRVTSGGMNVRSPIWGPLKPCDCQ